MADQIKGKGKVLGDTGPGQMELLDNDAFIKKLSELFESTKSKGTVWLTQKRYTYDPNGETQVDASAEYQCLLRATDGETKFETLISSAELPKFHLAYSTLLKTSMGTLKRRDRKREKQRSDKIAAKKKRLEEDVLIEGPKRGNGRKMRVRRVKQAMKQEEERKAAAKRAERREKVLAGEGVEWNPKNE